MVATLTSERLRLRPLETADSAAISSLLTDAEFISQEGRLDPAAFIAQWKDRIWLAELIETREPVGTAALTVRDRVGLLSYAIMPTRRRKGFGTEVARRVTRHAIDELGLQVAARVATDNEPSQRVLRAAGFAPVAPPDVVRSSRTGRLLMLWSAGRRGEA